MITMDANVLVAAEIRQEPGHVQARRFFQVVVGEGLSVHLPWLAVVESCVAVGRRLGDEALALKMAFKMGNLPNATFHSLDRSLSEETVALGAICRLRGTEAVYVAICKKYSTTLVTFDLELSTRTKAHISACSPEEWLASRKKPEPSWKS